MGKFIIERYPWLIIAVPVIAALIIMFFMVFGILMVLGICKLIDYIVTIIIKQL